MLEIYMGREECFLLDIFGAGSTTENKESS